MLGLTLRDAGWEVVEADSYVTALVAVRESPFDVVLADIWMPEPDMESLAGDPRPRCPTRPSRS